MRAHWISTVRVAFTALKTNRVRSALTMLGIVIGVAAVIATVAVGTGASQRVQAQIASIGSNMVIIIPGSLTSSGLQLGTGSATTLTNSDARELSAQCPDITYAAPAVRGAASVVYEGNNWGTTTWVPLRTISKSGTSRSLKANRSTSKTLKKLAKWPCSAPQ